MQCCLAFSANACGTDGAHQQTAGNETVNDNGESETDSVESGEGLFDLTQGENGKPPVITLSSGYTMPVLGLGTYSLHGDECINAILSAIKLGYRKFDTATFYGNEEEVGEAIRRSGVPREEFFICTKLYPNEFLECPVRSSSSAPSFIPTSSAMRRKPSKPLLQDLTLAMWT